MGVGTSEPGVATPPSGAGAPMPPSVPPIGSGPIAPPRHRRSQAIDRASGRPEFRSWWAKIRAMAAQGELVRGLLGGGAAYFHAPVRWLLGRDLLAQASSILLYSAFGTELDHRDWMYP